MDAKAVESQIRDKLSIIGDSIASFLNAEDSLISHRLLHLNFYVYEDFYNQRERILNVDLGKIAKEYALDVYDDLQLEQERIEELSGELSKLILAGYALDDASLKGMIEEFVDKQPEFKNVKKAAFNNVKGAINNFLRDYEVKALIDNLNSGEVHRENVMSNLCKIKANILKRNFKINVNDNYNLNWVWDTISAFTLDEDDLAKCSDEYKNRIYDMRKKFYLAAGCKGTTLEELEASAKKTGLCIDKKIALDVERECNDLFISECKNELRQYTNIFEIYDDLKEKVYTPDLTNIVYMFNNPSVYGVNFQIPGSKGLESYILFANNETLYTTEFNDTCIHEIVHYLGGINEVFNKRGLYYNDNKIYLDLEEAYVNAVSKKVMSKVVSQSGNIVEPCQNKDALNAYDHTLEYMNFVLKRYKKELSKVHLSTTINLAQANKLLPYDKIAMAVSRIMNCDPKDVKKYTLEEIEKLKKLHKKK